jgi:hypothetical protein
MFSLADILLKELTALANEIVDRRVTQVRGEK